MIKQIKQFGGSVVIILDKSTREYFGLEVGDFVDIADIVNKEKKNGR